MEPDKRRALSCILVAAAEKPNVSNAVGACFIVVSYHDMYTIADVSLTTATSVVTSAAVSRP